MCRFHFETENDIFLEATVNNERNPNQKPRDSFT